MKMPVSWHRQNLANSKSYLEQQREQFRRTESALARLEASYNESFEQYEEAVRRGVDGYDSDKFGKKRHA